MLLNCEYRYMGLSGTKVIKNAGAVLCIRVYYTLASMTWGMYMMLALMFPPFCWKPNSITILCSDQLR